MVERGDRHGQRQRLPCRENFPGLALWRDVAGENLAVVPQRFRGGKAQHVQRAAHFVTRLANAQARLSRDELGEFLAAPGQKAAGPVENIGAGKTGESFATGQAGFNRGFGLLPSGEEHPADQAPVVGTVDFESFTAGNLLSGNVTGMLHHGWVPLTVKSKISKLRGSPAALAA